jgi:DNA-binding IclR family transcriptional regulator
LHFESGISDFGHIGDTLVGLGKTDQQDRYMANASAATRALSALRIMAKSAGPVTAGSIAQRLGLPRSSTYHLLNAMEQEGYVIHYPSDSRWGLGVAAFELGQAYLRHDPLERLARPALAKLVHEVERQLPAIGHLAILHGTDAMYLVRELPRRPIAAVTEVGVRLPAHLTASGRAILAQLPAAQFKALYSGQTELPNRTGLGPKSVAELQQQLLEDRKTGISLEDGFITDGLSGVSVAVLDRLNHPVAALNLTFKTDQATPQLKLKMANALTAAAGKMARSIGHHD